MTEVDPDRAQGRIENEPVLGNEFQGRFNTTANGRNWWQANSSFEVFFANQSFSAFGFYGTDFGDFAGSLSLQLLDANRVGVELLTLPPSGGGSDNGSLLFFGFIDNARSYSGVRFLITQDPDLTLDEWDTLGFDDLTIGTLSDGEPQPAPEPGSLALAGAALLGLAAARRSQKS